MITADNQNMDLGLALEYSNNCTRIRMNENSGAGVNAGSSVNLKFPASDSLSELVWSPHKGPSLKCAEGSLPDKKSFLLWNVGPSNIDPSPSQSIRCERNDDDTIVAGNLVISKAQLHLDSEVARGASLTESPKNSGTQIAGSIPGLNMDNKDEMEVGVMCIGRTQNVYHLGGDENEVGDLAKQQKNYIPESSENDAGILVQNLLLRGPPDCNCDIAEAEASSVNLNKEIPTDHNLTSGNAVISCQILEEGSRASEGHTYVQSGAHISPLQILPSLEIPTEEVKGANEEERKNKFSIHGYMVPSGGKLEYTAENDPRHISKKDAYQQSEERLVRGYSVPLDTDAENHGSLFHQLKGKDKALSEGNFGRRSLLDNEDDSQESVESCNSACLLGKRRWNFSEQLMLENKRMKKDIDGNIASTSMIRHDSSFMNWISNMVNGFSKFNHEDGPSLDLTLAHSSHEDTSVIQDKVICSRLQEPMSRNTGFQTIFQSLYCPTKFLEAGTLENDSGQNDESCNHNFTSDEKVLPSTTEDMVGQSDQALIMSAITPIQNDFKTDPAENKESINQDCYKHKNGTSASVSLADHKITITDNGNPHLSSHGRATCEFSTRGNVFGSLWITRFTTKVCSTSLDLDNSNRYDCPAIWCPGDCATPNRHAQICPDFPIGEKYPNARIKSHENSVGLGKELQEFAANTESSLGFKKLHEENYQNPVPKLNSVQLSHKFKTSEAMASAFARRLDALKHIIPTMVETDASSRVPSSFFRGKSGHHLGTCSEASETERVEGVSEKQKSCFIDKANNLEDAAPSREKPCINASHGNAMSNGKEFSGNKSLSSNDTKNQINSNSMENKTRKQQSLPLSNLVSMDIAEVPEGVFEAVRRLQLSRADMLKWINSKVSLSQLEGLFLRLRLGKWEAGLGGTGYYVARITVDQPVEPLKDWKKSISVNVGGMKCLVGSQYISNHDFLEDELMVWWCRILKTGGKVPLKEDLDSKFKRRITLGF